MNAGVDHQPARAPHFVGQRPEILVRRLVVPHHRAEPLGVKPPALRLSGERGPPAKRRPSKRPAVCAGLCLSVRCGDLGVRAEPGPSEREKLLVR
jgi:hypothetical protein